MALSMGLLGGSSGRQLPVSAGAVFWADTSSFSGSTWVNILGSTGPANVTVGSATVVANNGNGATSVFNAIQGSPSTRIEFPAQVLPATYTLFHVTRYNGPQNLRIYTANDAGKNWLSGHWSGLSGVAYHEGWLTQTSSSIHGGNWLISTDQNSLYRSNGVTRGTGGGGATANLGINTAQWSGETSNFQTAEVIVYNRTLNASEITLVESYLSSKYGIAI